MTQIAGKALPGAGELVRRSSDLPYALVPAQQSAETIGVGDEEDEGQPTTPKKKKKKKKKKKQTTPSAGGEQHDVIDTNVAARVFKLEELATRIATHLLAISPESVVELALTCRALEAPALGALWENEGSLSSLIERVLPKDIQCYVGYDDSDVQPLVRPLFFPGRHPVCSLTIAKTKQAFRRPLTSWELNRLKRYTSWMRRLEVREWNLSEEITRLVLPSPDGTPPALPLHLRELNWRLNGTNLLFLPIFLSPYLKTVIITTDANRVFPLEGVEMWRKLPDRVIPVMRSAIKKFPPSPQIVCIKLGVGPEPRLSEDFSAFTLGCGEALEEFATNVVLSTQAIVHLMKLPNLRAWTTEQGPPPVTDLIRHGVPDGVISLFPSLWALDLRGEIAFQWLSLFEPAKNRSPPWILAGDSLPKVSYHHPALPIDSSLISRFLPFVGLVELRISMECPFSGPCISRYTDEDVERLTVALPKLEAVTLGEWPCSSGTCPTTIRSLLSFSIHCPKLRYLNIHFRTANLRADMLDLLGYAYSQGLHLRPKCILKTLVTQTMPLELSGYDPVLLSFGMLMIFPSLGQFYSRSGGAWVRLQAVAMTLEKVGTVANLTEGLMQSLNKVRTESVGGVVPADTAVSSSLPFGSTCEHGWAVCSLMLQEKVARVFCEPLSLLLGAIY